MKHDDLSGAQRAFAANIRDPERFSVPVDVPSDRMRVYRELFFNNIDSFLSTGFPVIHAILKGPRWTALVRDYYRDHKAMTPLFVEIAGEFVRYLETERGVSPEDPPFLAELAHYEWVELVLSVREADPPQLDEAFLQNPLGFSPRLSPLAWLLTYGFPVQKIGPDFQPEFSEREEVQLLVYRGRDEEVHFLELNPVTYGLLDALGSSPGLTLGEVLEATGRNIGHPDPQKVLLFGADLIRELHQKGVVASV